MKLIYARNCVEYAAEDWCPQNCLEEDQMVLTDYGELVHPIHVLRQQNLTRHFCAVMSVQLHRRAAVY
jgi:hypothetical protein